MCKTYNNLGSLTTLKLQLERNKIDGFKSLKEVLDFQHSYTTHRKQIISHHENLIEQEKNILNIDLQQLDTAIETQKLQSEKKLIGEIDNLKHQLNSCIVYPATNVFNRLTRYLMQRNYKKKIKYKERNYDLEVQRSICKLVHIHQNKSDRYQFIIARFGDAVKRSSQIPLSELERKKMTIDGLRSFIYGALGEQKVAKTLETLSDEYFLINDFAVSFSPPIYNRQQNDYIKSIQIDHVLVAPSGLFLIETKNWSEKSLENLSLRSPVQQVRRTSYILFKLLNNEINNNHLHLNKHHWGDKKIPIRNLIVMTNTKPQEEFQHVKILTLNELLGYVNYFKPIFSNNETQRIVEYLINVNQLKTLTTSRF